MHIDDVIDFGFEYPYCLRYYLLFKRLSASDQNVVKKSVGEPTCFANHNGKRVKLVMANKMGDIGITENLLSNKEYQKRVNVLELSDFHEKG
jgi:hypothetical protein